MPPLESNARQESIDAPPVPRKIAPHWAQNRPGGRGGTGRRAGLRIPYLTVWGFDSPRSHSTLIAGRGPVARRVGSIRGPGGLHSTVTLSFIALPKRTSGANDAAVVARIVRRQAHTFALAARLLPPERRRAAFALYAFCRIADDLVDVAAGGGDPEAARASLAEWEAQLCAAHRGEPTRDPVLRELQRAVRAYGVPLAVLRALVDGVRRDLDPVRYRTWGELAVYCEGVASTVGEMCTYVFGVPGGSAARGQALRHARTLGVAMQLTNILRDVGEDAARGRCFLPSDDLAHHDLTVGEVLGGSLDTRDARWQAFTRFQIGRARALYTMAHPGISLLEPDAQRCATACASGYAAILGAIESIRFDSLHQRARLTKAQRLRVLWDAWRSELSPGDLGALGQRPPVRFELGEPLETRDRVPVA